MKHIIRDSKNSDFVDRKLFKQFINIFKLFKKKFLNRENSYY